MVPSILEQLFEIYGVEPQDVALDLSRLAQAHQGRLPELEAELIIRKRADLQKTYRMIAEMVQFYGPAEVFNAWYCAAGTPDIGDIYQELVSLLDHYEIQQAAEESSSIGA